MEVQALLAGGSIDKVLVIDDAFAPPSLSDINGEALTLFSEHLIDYSEARELIEKTFGEEGVFDTSKSSLVHSFVYNEGRMLRLWQMRNEPNWVWVKESLFDTYQSDIDTKLSDIAPLLGELKKFNIHYDCDCDLNLEGAEPYRLIFLDFFLKDERDPDSAYERAAKLQSWIKQKRLVGGLEFYPLVVLISSRDQATGFSLEFKDKTGLRSEFFSFLSKPDAGSDRLKSELVRILIDYAEKQCLANFLDEYWVAVQRASDDIHRHIRAIEPSELKLLNVASLSVEKESVGDYLTWLIGAFLSNKILDDQNLARKVESLPAVLSVNSLAGNVPATSQLADMFLKAGFRGDVSDDRSANLERYALALGDVFVCVEDGRLNYNKLFVICDQSCDLRHSLEKTRVVCLWASDVQEITDLMSAFYANGMPTSGRPPQYLIKVLVEGVEKYLWVTFSIDDPDAISRESLKSRTGYKRIGRFSQLLALQIQERFTQNLGRIGAPVSPPRVSALSVSLILRAKGQQDVVIDSRNQNWASLIIVQGRHDLTPPKSIAAEGEENVVSAVKKDDSIDKTTKSRASFTEEYIQWLAEYLDSNKKPSPPALATQWDGLKLLLASRAVQHLEIVKKKDASVVKTSGNPKEIYLSFSQDESDRIEGFPLFSAVPYPTTSVASGEHTDD